MGVSHWPSPFPVPVFSFRLAHGRRRIVIKEDLAAEDRKRMAAVPVSSLSGPGPPPCTNQQHSCCGRAWRGVATVGGSRACHRWARRKRQPPEGELLQWAPQIHHHLDHHLSHTFPGRTRPKKE